MRIRTNRHIHACTGTHALSPYIFISHFLLFFLFATSFLLLFSILLLSFDRKSRSRKKPKENVDVTQNVKLTSTYPPNSFKANQPYAVQFMSNMFMCKFYMVFGLVKIKRIKMKESDKRIEKNGIL